MKKFLAALAVGLLAVIGLQSPAMAVTTHFYSLGYQFVTATGVAANLGIYSPNVYNSDHTLAEIMIKNAAGDTIELGWRKVAGDVPRLWAGHWEAGVFQGYNNADILDVAGGVNLGDSLNGVVGTVKAFQIWHGGTDWFFAYNGTTVAYLPDSSFSPTMTTGNEVQAFAEVASPTTATPCTDMWTGSLPTAPATGGVVSSAKYYNTSGVQTAATLTKVSPTPTQYNHVSVAAGTFVYGGPGFC